MARATGSNDHTGKIKEVIANTEANIGDTEETLQSVHMSEHSRAQLEALNERRAKSVQDFKQALEQEFSD